MIIVKTLIFVNENKKVSVIYIKLLFTLQGRLGQFKLHYSALQNLF